MYYNQKHFLQNEEHRKKVGVYSAKNQEKKKFLENVQ